MTLKIMCATHLSFFIIYHVSLTAYIKIIHKKSYTMVHCWRELKKFPKWPYVIRPTRRVSRMVGGSASTVIDVEEEGPTNGVLPSRPRGHRATKADLKCDACICTCIEIDFESDDGGEGGVLAKRDVK
jgi:hypothetical protein